jgi:AcrR family transcriptional regulator
VPRTKLVEDDAVLDATLNLIARLGPEKLTLAAVGREVGLSAATIVQRFGSKQALLRAVAGRAAETDEPLATHAALERSPLTALIDALVARAQPFQNPEAFVNHLAFLHLDLQDPELLEFAQRGSVRFRRRIREVLDAAVAAGELAPTATDKLAGTVEVVYNGALLSWGIDRDHSVGDTLRGHLDRFFMTH